MRSCLVAFVKVRQRAKIRNRYNQIPHLTQALIREEDATLLQMEKLEIRVVIKYFCRTGMSPKETHKDFMKILRKESLSYSTVKKWAAEFKRGRESVEDIGQSGRPKDATNDENVTVVHTLVLSDWMRDLRSIASEVGIA